MARAAADDWRALSLLETEQPTPIEIAGGVGFAFASFVLLPALVIVSGFLLGGMEALFGMGADDLPPPPIEVIETRFVRLGKQRPQRRLPSKEIPAVQQSSRVPTGPESDAVAPVPSGKNEKGLAKPDKKRKQQDDDLLAQLGQRAGAISDLRKGPELEGHEEGIIEGTKATGDEKDLYLGKLYSYFRRGWQVPTLIPADELQKLTCVVELSITEDGRIGDYEVTRSSGNEAFDDSVRRRLSQAEGAELPTPPESVAKQVLGETISLRFFGRHAR
ncbi:MAG: cell envelope integrity protein TolA [Myxococcales bacterium]|nr:MAG: cell envelope integrity protein TolA [Myxococcales bacterium]